MANTPNADNPTYPEWWDDISENEVTDKWHQSVDDFFAFHGTKAEDYKFSVDLVKQMLGHIAMRDKRWLHFPTDDFITGQYEAHDQLYHAIRNKVLSMQKKAKKAKEEKEAKAKAKEEEQKKEAEAREKAESKKSKEVTPAKEQTQINSKSMDSVSVGSSGRKRTSKANQKLFNDIPSKQTKIGKGDNG